MGGTESLISFFLHNRTWIPALSPWPSPLAQAAGLRPHEGTSNLTPPRWALSPASSSVSDPKLPPPTLPQGGCVSSVCGGPPPHPSTRWVYVSSVVGVTPVPVHMVAMCLLCVWWDPPWPFHLVGVYLLVCTGVPLPLNTVCVCVCVWSGVPPALPHGGCVPSVCGGVHPTLPHGGRVSCVCVGVLPGPFTQWACTFCVWWGPPSPSTQWVCVWWSLPYTSTQWACIFCVCGGVPLGKQKTGNVYLKHVEKYSYTAMK